jgi:hypothetical protein
MGWDRTKAKQQLAKDREIARAGQVGRRIKGTSGRCTLAIDQETFVHTVEANGGVRKDGKTIFDDPGFMADMKREHPHLRGEGEIAVPRNWGRTALRIRILPGGVVEETDLKKGTYTLTHPDGRVETA